MKLVNNEAEELIESLYSHNRYLQMENNKLRMVHERYTDLDLKNVLKFKDSLKGQNQSQNKNQKSFFKMKQYLAQITVSFKDHMKRYTQKI